ncbi:MAG: lamin tail domain-containing protein, partial [Planctomycetota bacterium]|nr:lamin tail domain-containing protein [Planctomycetota bacterium]
MKTLLLSLSLVASLTCLSAAQSYPKGDLNGDYIVNLEDLQLFTSYWLNSTCSAPDCPADLDGIPGVNESDFAILAENWRAHGKIPLVINELMAKNNSDSGIHDEWGEYDDWIEIYNYGEDAIDIGGMWMTDNLDAGPRWQIPRGNPALTTIASHGYLLIWADNETGEGILHASFALDGGGEDIGLYDADENLIDSIEFGSQQQNKSYGRLPNGSASWQILDGPTPRGSNRGAPIAIVINEIMYHPYHALNTPENMGQEYIELWNRGIEAVNLKGWRFVDGVDYVFPDVTLNAGSYLVVAADVNAFKAKYPSVSNVVGGWSGRLANSGEHIVLIDNGDATIDWVGYA